MAVVSARAQGGPVLGPQEAGGGGVQSPAVQRGRGRGGFVLDPGQQQRVVWHGDRLRDHVGADVSRPGVGDGRVNRRTDDVRPRHREDLHHQGAAIGEGDSDRVCSTGHRSIYVIDGRHQCVGCASPSRRANQDVPRVAHVVGDATDAHRISIGQRPGRMAGDEDDQGRSADGIECGRRVRRERGTIDVAFAVNHRGWGSLCDCGNGSQREHQQEYSDRKAFKAFHEDTSIIYRIYPSKWAMLCLING